MTNTINILSVMSEFKGRDSNLINKPDNVIKVLNFLSNDQRSELVSFMNDYSLLQEGTHNNLLSTLEPGCKVSEKYNPIILDIITTGIVPPESNEYVYTGFAAIISSYLSDTTDIKIPLHDTTDYSGVTKSINQGIKFMPQHK